jgi:hypothetical protein
MNFEKLMNRKVSRRDFLKSLGFVLLALVFFPRKAFSFLGDDSSFDEKSDVDKKFFGNKIVVDGVTVMEVEDH